MAPLGVVVLLTTVLVVLLGHQEAAARPKETTVGMDSSDDNQLGTLDDNEEHSRTSNDLQRKRAIAADKKRRFSDTFDPIGRAGHFGGLGDDDTIRHRKPKWRKGKKHNKHMYGLAHGIAGIGRATNFRKSLLKGLQKRAFERVAAAKRQRQRRR